MSQSMQTLEVADQPDVAALEREGWAIISVTGPYYTLWRDCEESLVLWKDGHWQGVDGCSDPLPQRY